VINYEVWYANDSSISFVLLKTTALTSYIATNLTSGTNYKFYVYARNSYGLS